mmetsp:Transcript_8811/g.19063  ORF Transcript_8811/g.19063 Transcript_8811/m.19063 type:complete len:137 (-) Transcript_8811:501-911(-)
MKLSKRTSKGQDAKLGMRMKVGSWMESGKGKRNLQGTTKIQEASLSQEKQPTTRVHQELSATGLKYKFSSGARIHGMVAKGNEDITVIGGADVCSGCFGNLMYVTRGVSCLGGSTLTEGARVLFMAPTRPFPKDPK